MPNGVETGSSLPMRSARICANDVSITGVWPSGNVVAVELDIVAAVTVDSGVSIVIGSVVSEGTTFPVGEVLPWSNKLVEVGSRSASRCLSSASVPLEDVEGLQDVRMVYRT